MTAFSGFLRCGEFTIQAGKAFDPSKMDPFKKRVAITIASAPGAHTCAVATLKSLFKHIEKPESPLFLQDDSAPMSHNFSISQVRYGLTRAGFNASKFSGDSFCCRVASLATAIGFNNYEIQLLGRWRSNSYKLYINNFLAHLLSLSSHLHWAIPHGQLYKPLSLLPSYLA